MVVWGPSFDTAVQKSRTASNLQDSRAEGNAQQGNGATHPAKEGVGKRASDVSDMPPELILSLLASLAVGSLNDARIW